MNKPALLSMVACALALPACSGGRQTPVPQSAAAQTSVPSGYIATAFMVAVPNAKTQSHGKGIKNPQYVSPSTLSVQITLNTVNGVAPPGGLTTTVTTNVLSGACNSGCAVNGPAVPPGDDNFTVSEFDASNAGGARLATLTQTFTVTAGQANPISIVLQGIPASFTIAGVPPATAGTAFGSPSALTLTVKDADGNTIPGTYANPVTFSTTDTSSLVHASALSVNGGSAASSVTINASTDTLTLKYGGQAIAPSTLSASAAGATTNNAAFAPTLSPIVPTSSEIDLYATSGTGSTATVTVAETGWSNSPYNQNFTVSVPGGCSSIAGMSGNASATTGTTFNVSVAGSPAVGSCTATFTDGAGQSHGMTLTYTTTSIGVDAARRRSAKP